MFDLGYTLFIQPLEFWMNKALLWGFNQTHSWGLAIIVMSLVVNVVILPIYLKAESWQEEERSIRKLMQNDEMMIKEAFKGQERFAMISTLYRQRGFSPLMTLRSSIGFFLQIPFFFAAYHFLGHFDPFQGVSFLGISNLAEPDEIVTIGDLHINFMPILMTVINLASALIYTQNLSKKDKVQLYGMAGLFLIFLYNAASGLVLYWTFNNIFSLIKNSVTTYFSNYKNLKKESFISWNVIALLTLIGLILPELIWLTDTNEISVNPRELLSQIIAIYLAVLLATFLLWTVIPQKFRRYVDAFALFALFIVFLYGSIFTGNYGNLQGNLLSNPAELYNRKYNYFKDITIFILATGVIYYLYKRALLLQLGKCLTLALFVTSFFMTVKIANIPQSSLASPEDRAIYANKLFGYSKDHNLVVIVLDMFTGDHFEKILNEFTEFNHIFDGFTYYPDTLASGSGTQFGIPAILGGGVFYIPRDGY